MSPASIYRRALILIFALLLALGALSVRPAFAATYTVQDGDTLFSIGAKMGVDDDELSDWAEEVVELNDLDSVDALTVGQKLTLPGTTSGSSSASSGTRSTGALPPASGVTYTIKSGDSLLDIAAKTGVSESALNGWIEDVVKLNNLRSPDALVAGDTLQLPGGRSGTSSTLNTSASSGGARTSAITGATTYTVKDGDTLLGIAINQGVPDEEITKYIEETVKLSALGREDMITVGQVLKLPYGKKTSEVAGTTSAGTSASSTGLSASSSVTVKDGDSLYSIADDLKVPLDQQGAWLKDVLKLNEMDDADKLRVGQKLLVPDSYKPPVATVTSSGPTGPVPAAPPASAQSELIRAPGATSCLYTIRSGDTLAIVAQKLGIPEVDRNNWTTYVALLNGVDANALPAGNGIRVPC